MMLKLMCTVLLVDAFAKKLSMAYEPIWDDLDVHPLPEWYDVAKIGIFVHWGLYSVPAFHSEWFWYDWEHGNAEVVNFVLQNNITSYEGFALNFTGEYFDPDDWAELFFKAGAKYVVLTSKHHDGFALFPSSGSPEWNSIEIGPHKDIVHLLSKSVRKYHMKFGLYYSLLEWHNRIYPMAENGEGNNKTGVEYVENIMLPDIKKLIHNYKPSVLWADGDWAEKYYGSWRAEEILAWIYNEGSVKDEIVVNDRWGMDARNNHGDFFSGDTDRYNPKKLIYHKFENAFTIDKKSWGFIRDMDVMSFEEMLETVVSTVSFGGNALINVGPMKEGVIPPIFRERLLQLGEWLKVNGEAIYGTSPWYYQQDSINPAVWYTCKKKTYDPMRVADVPSSFDEVVAVYAIFFKWSRNGFLALKNFVHPKNNRNYKMYLLIPSDLNVEMQMLNYTLNNGSAIVHLPVGVNSKVFEAWVLKITS